MEERAAGGRRLHALAVAQQERCRADLHVANPGARRGDGEVHALRAGGDAAGLDDVEEQVQIGQIEAHDSFAIREG